MKEEFSPEVEDDAIAIEELDENENFPEDPENEKAYTDVDPGEDTDEENEDLFDIEETPGE